MIKRVVVIGGSIGGLAVSLGLARSDCSVTVIERDPPAGTDDVEAAFAGWQRPSVPQARQPHGFSARTRNLLAQHAPDLLRRMLDAGVEEWNVLDMAPPELRIESDVQFTGLLVRRLPFELVLRQAVEDEPAIDVRSPAVVDGLLFSGERTVCGVRLRDGTELHADVVIDASGRRAPVVGWLAERGIAVPEEVEDCNLTYYGRYYRQHTHSDLDRSLLLLTNPGDLGYLSYGLFTGDARTLSLFLGAPPWDRDLRELRHNRVWEAAVATMPAIAPWIDPAHTEPITDVQPMAGHQNVLRRYVVDGEPLVLGLLPVGDALCTTNPAFGWGASLTLTYAFAAVDAVWNHGDDLRTLARAYDDQVIGEAESYFRVSSAQDRLRTYRWRGESVPERDRAEAERQDLLDNGLGPAMRRDMHVLRAMMRRQALIDPPDAIWSDEQALAVGRETAEWRKANRRVDSLGPSRDELLDVMAGARADAVPVRA